MKWKKSGFFTAAAFFVLTGWMLPAKQVSGMPGYHGQTKSSEKQDGYVSAARCYGKLNAIRKRSGVKRLKKDRELVKKARIRAREIVKKFSHIRPNGRDALTMISVRKAAGENIASGQTDAGEVMRDWQRSKPHRENMLDRDFKKVGIAGYRYKGVTYWVQMFSS